MQYPSTKDTVARARFGSTDDLLPEAAKLLPKCDEILIRSELAEAAQRFCRETHCFEVVSDIPVVLGTKKYTIPVDYPADILTVREVRVSIVHTADSSVREYVLSDRADVYRITEDSLDDDDFYLTLMVPIDTSAADVATLKVSMALIPSIDEMSGTQAYALPEKLIKRWRAAFVSGAVMSLAAMRKKGWSDPELAAIHAGRWDELHSEARIRHFFRGVKQGGLTCQPDERFV